MAERGDESDEERIPGAGKVVERKKEELKSCVKDLLKKVKVLKKYRKGREDLAREKK